MNNKGFAISVILYSMVFLLISVFYMLLGIVKSRYNTSTQLRDTIVEELNESKLLYDVIEYLGDVINIDYVKKYDVSNGGPIDLYDGTGNKDIYYFTSNDSSNLALKNGNVVFGNFCWQIVRTTTNGGVKLIYNGLKTSDNKCPNNSRPSSVGVVGSGNPTNINIQGNKVYGESFEIYKDGNDYRFRLLHTNTYSWSDLTYQNILGKFACGISSEMTGVGTTCDYLYYVGAYYNSESAYIMPYTIGTNSNYSVIGTSSFNVSSDFPSLVGYMFNDTYLSNNRNIASTDDFIFGNSVTYSTGNYTIDTNSDTTKYHHVTNWGSNYNTINNSHYTCFKNDSNSCGNSIYYVYYTNDTTAYYIELKNGEKIEDALKKMFNSNNSIISNINKYNSAIKGVVDSWFEQNLLSISSLLDDNEVYCNERSIKSLGGWSPTGNTTSNYELKFTYYDKASLATASLACPNVTDRFSKNNPVAKLKFAVGLLSESERALMQTTYSSSNILYRIGTPYDYSIKPYVRVVNLLGDSLGSYDVESSYGIRPVITLKNNVEVTGKGTYNNPYIVNTDGNKPIELRSINITAKKQTINSNSAISSATNQVTITSMYEGEGTLRRGDYLQSITLTQSTNEVTENGTITPSNAIIYDADGNDVTNLYEIKYVDGTLEVIGSFIVGSPYTVEYYLGNGSDTDGATKLGTTSCVQYAACSLSLFSSFNVAFPYSSDDTVNINRGWRFYGWTTSETSTSIVYQDGESIDPTTYTSTLKLYAVGRKRYRFNTGIAPKSFTATHQYWNPYSKNESNRSAINIPAGTDLSSSVNGSWTFLGYIGGTDSAANGNVHFPRDVAGTSYKPIIDTGGTGLIRSKYSRTLTINYDGNSNTGGSTAATTLVQYYNSGYGSEDGTTNTGATLGSYAMNLRNNGFTRTNYIFKNWTEGSTSGTAFAAGAAYNKLGTTVKSTNLETTMYAAWLKDSYTITYKYHETGNYDDDDYLNTGYTINWGRNTVIEVDFKYTTTGVRHLIVGTYSGANSKNLNIEVTAGNKLRLYMGDGAVDKESSTSLPTNKKISIKYTYNASTKAYGLTATADGMSDISISGTKTMSGTAPNTLWTNRDHRGTGTFKKITISRLLIKDKRATNSTLSDLPTVKKSGMTYKGWYTAETGGTKISTTKTVTADATYHLQYKTWTKKTFNCTKGVYGKATSTQQQNSCVNDVKTESQANASNLSSYVSSCSAVYSLLTCQDMGLSNTPCYNKIVKNKTSCSTYSSSPNSTETGLTSCSASTNYTKKITCTEE